MLNTIILVIHALIAIALCGVILLQRSEGGGLGIGGGNAGGMMTARGAADLLTRSTTILGALFISTSILLAVLAATGKRSHAIDTTLAKRAVTSAPATVGGVQVVPNAAPAAAPPRPVPADQVPLAN